MFHLLKNVIMMSMLFLGYTSSAHALNTDKNEILHIVSDGGTYNYKTGVDIFEGHVKLDQGTTHLTADKVITKRDAQRKIEQAIAYGINEQAHYWTKPNSNDPEIHAHAKVMTFYPINSNIRLEDEVTLTQGENTFNGQLILYNDIDQTITVPGSKNNRAILVYTPEK
jgi:lipopolysaccharide export system protein LptA